MEHELIFNTQIKKTNNLNNSNKMYNTKSILSSKKKQKINSHLFYSPQNSSGSSESIKEYKTKEIEENKNKVIRLLSQKINVIEMKIEILQNYKKKKNLNSIKKKIEYNKIYCINDLKRLKDKYYDSIRQNLKFIKYLKIRALKCEDQFLTIKKHKEIINKEELDFKIKKMDLIEKIMLLQKRLYDFLNPESTNDTYLNDDSYEEQTIKDMSLNEFSIKNSEIEIEVNYSYNFNCKKPFFNDKSPYESKIIKINPNEVNNFYGRLIKNEKDAKNKIRINKNI